MQIGKGVLGRGVLGGRVQSSAGSITIGAPADSSTVGTGFAVSGTTSSSGDVEYRIDAGAWAPLATPSGGSYAGTVSGVATGARTLEVRQSDDTGVTASASLTVVADAITITSPTQYTLVRHLGAGSADISVDVDYYGLPGSIEARLNRTGAEGWGSTAADNTGSQTITLSSEAEGYGTLEVRFSSAPAVTDSVADVAIGTAVAIWGQSNGSGRGTNNQSAPSGGAYLYDGTGALRALADPSDGNFGGTADYGTLDDGGSAAGSWVPRFATRMLTDGKPVLIINCCKGGTALSAWARNLSTGSMYGAAKARCDNAGGVDYVIWHQGESDAIAGTTESTYESGLTTLVGDIRSDLGNPTVAICFLHYHTTAANVDAIRNAQNTVATTVTGATLGGDFSGVTTALHFVSDAELTDAGNRVYDAMFGAAAHTLAATGSAVAALAAEVSPLHSLAGIASAVASLPAAAQALHEMAATATATATLPAQVSPVHALGTTATATADLPATAGAGSHTITATASAAAAMPASVSPTHVFTATAGATASLSAFVSPTHAIVASGIATASMPSSVANSSHALAAAGTATASMAAQVSPLHALSATALAVASLAASGNPADPRTWLPRHILTVRPETRILRARP